MKTTLGRRPVWMVLVAAGSVALAACGSGADDSGGTDDSAAGASLDSLNIIVPADPGGGWDQTGRALEEVVTGNDLASSTNVTNVGGAGGTIGLATLANEQDPYTLMVTGLVMVGAVETNESETRIEDTTPIARLTEEPLVIVVPAESPYQTVDDLVEDIVVNGKDVTVTGGSAGGADHILAGLLLGAAGVPPEQTTEKLNYVPNAGGGEAVSLLLGNNASSGISGVAEFSEQVKSGELRALAVSGSEPSALLPDVPTLQDEGYDVELTNWRGVLAPGGIEDAERQELIDVVTSATESPEWEAVLEENAWDDAFLPGDEFDSYLEGNITEVNDTLVSIGLVQ